MPDPTSTFDSPNPSLAKYGAASRFDFDNPQKWHTVSGVPLLDEHELTNDAGRPIATVDREVLQEIANNNNHKVRSTGDPATLILGHTSDDPRAPEKPAKGFVVNYSVRPFRRDETGKVIYAIHGDYKLRPQNAHLIEEYPRRSVELWWSRKDIDPIAMLGGSSPERDLGAVIRNGRLNHVALGGAKGGTRTARRESDDTIRFHRRGDYVIEDYSIQPVRRYQSGKTTHGEGAMGNMNGNGNGKGTGMGGTNGKMNYNADCGPGGKGKMRYGEDDLDPGLDTHDAGDDGIPNEEPDPHGTQSDYEDTQTSPAVNELLQSKPFREMSDKLNQLFDMISGMVGGAGGGGPGGGDMGGAGGDDGMGGMDEMPPPGAEAGGGGMDAPGGDAPMPAPTEEDSRRGMGQRPVQMNAGGMGGPTAFPGQGDVNTSDFNNKKRMSRPTQQAQRGGAMTATERQLQEKVIRLERRDRENRLRYAHSEAARRVEALVGEGYIFGRTPQEHNEGVQETVTHFTALLSNAPTDAEGTADVEFEEKIIRTRYAKKRTDPAQPTRAGLPRVGQYARNPNDTATPQNDAENFDPVGDEEVCEYAELVGARKMSRREAGEVMLRRRGSRA